MDLIPPESLNVTTSEHRSIAYTNRFKELVKQNPGTLSEAKSLIHDVRFGGDLGTKDRVERNGVYVEKLKHGKAVLGDRYKMGIGENDFFVKRVSHPSITRGDGFKEAITSEEVSERAKEMKNVKVVDFQFGFSDGKDSYYVATWNDILTTTLFDYMLDLYKQMKQHPGNHELSNQFNLLQERAQELKKSFPDLRDFDTHNMAYDDKTGSIWLFDLNKK